MTQSSPDSMAGSGPDPASPRSTLAHAVGIALVASSVLAYQIVLMRLFAIESYASFGAMVISVALLGFGLSGTLLTVFRDAIVARRDAVLFWSAVITVPLMLGARLIQQDVPFVPGKMLADPDHVWWIAVYYVSALVPIFTASMYIGVTLVGFTRDVHTLYFADLSASGVGAFVVLGLMYAVPPEYLILVPLVPVGLGGIAVARNHLQRGIAAVVLLAAGGWVLATGEVKFNEYKDILGTLRTADISGAHVIAERYGPMGYVQVVESRSERTAPGLSAATPFGISPPEQYALFVDGSKIGSLARALEGDNAKYLEWLISALPYELAPEKPRALALQVGGGEAVVEALHHGARRVLGVTTNPHFVDLMEQYSDYNGNLLTRDGVDVRIGESRAVAETSGETFDLVMMRGLDSSGLSAASTPGMTESYLLTVEAFRAYIRALDKGGMVAVTMRLSVPPWKAVRLIPTVAAALRAEGHTDIADKIVFVRDTFLGLLMIRPAGFSADDVATVREFSRRRSFDVSYVPGITDAETNQYTILLDETYTDMAKAVLEEDHGQAFLDGYLFDVSPTTDDRPYFGSVVRKGTSEGLKDYQRRSVEALAASTAPSGQAGGDVPNLDGGGDVPNLDGGGDIPDLDGGGDIPDLDGGGEIPDPESGDDATETAGADDDAIPDLDAGGDIPDEPGAETDSASESASENAAPGDRSAEDVAAEEAAEAEAAAEEETGIIASLRHVPVELWGEYTQWYTLAQALLFGLLIIVIPLIFSRRGLWRAPSKAKALVYFACLGFGFMCAEMVLIRKLTLLLANPIFATTIVLAAILLFSGIGSLFAARYEARPGRGILIAASGVVLTVGLYLVALDPIVKGALGAPTIVRMLLAVVVIAPAAFFLGFPFPTAMAALDADPERRGLVPWAWAINGATSVVAANGAELIGTHLGFQVLLLIVCGCYALALVTFPGARE